MTGRTAPRGGEIGGGQSVQLTEASNAVGPETFGSVATGVDQRAQFVPSIGSLGRKTFDVHVTLSTVCSMSLDDHLRIDTPEGVAVEIALAGLGSRFLARLLDVVIQAAALLALSIMFSVDNGFVRAILIIGLFLVLFAYDVFFEVIANGRTPGKMAAGIRVVTSDGAPIGFVASAVRNLLRIVDGCSLITVFLAPVGIISMFTTSKHQRLGDLAAGTVVVRDRIVPPPPPVRFAVPLDAPFMAWDVSAVTIDEVTTIRRYLDRRLSLDPGARHQIGEDLARRLRPKVAGAEAWPAELFLEGIVAAKSARG